MRARVYKDTFLKKVSHDYYLAQGDKGDKLIFLHDLPNDVNDYIQKYPILQNNNETEASVQKWFNKLMAQFEIICPIQAFNFDKIIKSICDQS